MRGILVRKLCALSHASLTFVFGTERLKGLLDKEEQEPEVIKDSPDSPEPANKKPRLCTEEVQPAERAKGTNRSLCLEEKSLAKRPVSK